MQKDDRTAMTAEQYVCFKYATDPFLARQIQRNGMADSHVYHDVRYVGYETADEPLSEEKPKHKPEPVYEF